MQRLFKHHNLLLRLRHYTTATATVNPLLTKYKQQLSSHDTNAWDTYQTLKKQNQIDQLKREEFQQLRTTLWKEKTWGSESRILQVLEDMKIYKLAWTVSEYNEYFIAKLFQSQYQDILSAYQQDFIDNSKMKLSIGSFNVILATYLQLGNKEEAVKLIKEAHKKWDVIPDIRDFDRTMYRCMPKNSPTVKKAKELIKQFAFVDNTTVLNKNLIHLFQEKRLHEIKTIMEGQRHKKQEISTYDILIRGYSDARATRDALNTFQEMQSHKIKPNNHICASMLSIYAHGRDIVSAEQIVRDTVMGGYKADEIIYNQLIKVYFKARQTRKAFQAFEEIQKDPSMNVNDVILNTMINGLVMNKEMKIAGLVYDQIMKSTFKPDMITFNTMLKGYLKANQFENAIAIMKDMFSHKMEPDTVTYTTLLDVIFNKQDAPTTSRGLLEYITQLGITPNIFTFNAMMNGWIKQGCIDQAEETLDLMKSHHIKPTVHTYTNIIQGYIEQDDLNKAMMTFSILFTPGAPSPDRATFNFMIVGFLNHNRLSDAYACLEKMKQMKVLPTKETWKIMLDDVVSKKDWVVGKKVVELLDSSGFEITSNSLKRPYTIVKSHCT